RVEVYPHQLKRYYPNGIVETVTMLDSVNAIIVELENVQARELVVYPLLSGQHSEDEFATLFERNILLIGARDHQARTPQDDYPPVVAVSWAGENLWTAAFYDSATIGANFSPASIKTVQNVPYHALVFAAGDSIVGAYEVARTVARN